MIDWHQYSNGLTLRPQQIEALNLLAAASSPVVILQAPPGAGKSAILTTYFSYLQDTCMADGYLLTPQRALQRQLGESRVPGIRVMYGARNYRCPLQMRDPENHSNNHTCPYYTAIEQAIKSPLVIHNYASFLHQRKHFKRRYFLGLDEGHRAARALVDFLTLELTEEERDALAEFGDVSLTTLREMASIQQLGLKQAEVIAAHRRDGSDPDVLFEQTKGSPLAKLFRQLQSYWWLYGYPTATMRLYGYDGAVSEYDIAGDTSDVFELDQPVDLEFALESVADSAIVAKLTPTRIAPAGRLLMGRAHKTVITSATVLSARQLAAELGVTTGYEYIELPSTFPADSRPILLRYCGRMTQREQGSTLPRVVSTLALDAIRHADEAGIVHTVSHELARTLLRELSEYDDLRDRLIQLPVGPSRDGVIEQFLAGALGPNRILIGPGLHEGVDGAYDSARWQAIVKAPLPYLGDIRYQAIKRRSAPAAAQWYAWQAAQTFAQMCGRVTRASDDYGVTYVYDSVAQEIIDGAFCPEYVREAITR